ncbi:shikimate kinase [Streptococcus merionis]|uniref:Shikimate kinase n=1 Tax=Streptococcus merionis TaxID=400065 RepID=A0A239SSW2_9STRE|nr:shikimate kinase [Streptococcus merionis]SNU88510.1 shikimate kinase [Streptococcus merionis]
MAKVFLGFMGSGKSTIAERLDKNYVDMDVVITERLGMSIAKYFEEKGEASFRQIESQVLAELLSQDIVLSTGGGVVISEANRKLLAKNSPNIYLSADFESLYQRLSQDQENQRPLFLNQSKASLKRLYEQRLPLYEAVATQIIDVIGKKPEEIVEMLS